MYRFKVDQLLTRGRTIQEHCGNMYCIQRDEWSDECPRPDICTKKRHDICTVGCGTVGITLANEFRLDFKNEVEVAGRKRHGSIRLLFPVSVADADKVMEAIRDAFAEDLALQDLSMGICRAFVPAWLCGWTEADFYLECDNIYAECDYILDRDGALTVNQIFDFYTNSATGEVDFGPFKNLREVADNCFLNLHMGNYWTPATEPLLVSSPAPPDVISEISVAHRHLVELRQEMEEKMSAQRAELEQCKKLLVEQKKRLDACEKAESETKQQSDEQAGGYRWLEGGARQDAGVTARLVYVLVWWSRCGLSEKNFQLLHGKNSWSRRTSIWSITSFSFSVTILLVATLSVPNISIISTTVTIVVCANQSYFIRSTFYSWGANTECRATAESPVNQTSTREFKSADVVTLSCHIGLTDLGG